MTALEQSMLPDAIGQVTKAGVYQGVDVVPGDILLSPNSPAESNNLSQEELLRIGTQTTTGGFDLFGLFRPKAALACGTDVVLHADRLDVTPYGIYDYRRLAAISEDSCSNVRAYYRQRLWHVTNSVYVATYHDVDEITLRHEDWDTGGDGIGYVDSGGAYQDGGPAFGTIDPDDIRGPGDSPNSTYIRGGAFHPKGYQDRWQTFGQLDTLWYPQYDIWASANNVRLRHCSDMFTSGGAVTQSREGRIDSACNQWYS